VPFDALAENLVNSHDLTLDVPEHLQTVADLSGFLREHDIDWPGRLGAPDLEQVKRLRGRARELFEADTQAAAIRSLNELLDGARVNMNVVKERAASRIVWTVDTTVDLAEALRSAVAVSVAHLVMQFGFERLRVCGGTPCADVFLDVSKRGAQRFCGPRCATRVRVAAHRARQ
jgi:predicted RNA-binding Zn ribbon-like protein